MKSSRKPDYRLKGLNKVTNEKYILGAGWKNDDGSVTVVLNDFVVITSTKDLLLTLFPIDT